MRRVPVRAVVAAVGLLTLASPPLRAQQRLYSPDERILVGDGGVLRAVAVSPFEVYAASDFGILVFDAVRGGWKTPVPLPLDMVATRPSALAWDRAGGTLWLGTESGDLYSTVPGFRRWDRITGGLRGRVESITVNETDAAVYLLAGGEWLRVPAGSFFPERVPANALPAAVARRSSRQPDDAWLRAARGTLGLDARNRRWPVTDLAEGREPGEYWISTGGGGLVRYDSRFNRQEWHRYGLAAAGAGSIVAIDGTLWFGSDGRDVRGGVAWTDSGLDAWGQQFREDGAPGGFVAEIAAFAGSLWFASDDGLFRLRGEPTADRRGNWTRLTTAHGLASDRVRSLGEAAGVLWVGTDRGLTPFDSSGTALREPLLAGQRISRVAVHRDTLFIAADRGLQILTAGGPATPRPAAASPALRGPLADVVADDSLMFAIAGGAVIDVRGPGTPLRDAALDRIGQPFRLALHDGQLWVAGPGGIARRDPVSRVWQAFTVPEDVHAGPVVDVFPDGDWVWAATPAGAVRLRWR